MPNPQSERLVSTKEKTSDELSLSYDQWRYPFNFAYKNWLKRGGNPSSSDTNFAVEARKITNGPDYKHFPRDKKFSAADLKDDAVLFLVCYLGPDYIHQPYFERLAEKRGLLQPRIGEQVQVKLARPAFIVKVLEETQSAA